MKKRDIIINRKRGKSMIDINRIREYYKDDMILFSGHALERIRQRGIKQKDIKSCIMSGEIIEQYPDDFPFPSCLIYGIGTDERVMHVVASDEGTASRIITAYFPNLEKFESDLKTRRERK